MPKWYQRDTVITQRLRGRETPSMSWMASARGKRVARRGDGSATDLTLTAARSPAAAYAPGACFTGDVVTCRELYRAGGLG